jgi:hypothetical protein
MKRPFLILVICTILPCFVYSQTDTAAAPPAPPAASETTETDDDGSAPGTWMFAASGGWTFPFEPASFADHYKTNYNLGEGFAYALPAGDVGYGEVGVMFHYYSVLLSKSGFRKANDLPDTTDVYGTPGNVITGMLQFRGVLGSKESVAPYFTVGIGLYHIYLPAVGIVNSTEYRAGYHEITFGWSAGLGLDVPVSDRFTLFADGKFILGVTETNGHKLFTAGGGFRYTM